MALDDLIRTGQLLNDPAVVGDDLLGEVLAVNGGTVTVVSDDLDGRTRQHVVRGHWPSATPGDAVLLRVLPRGLWAIGWEPA